jgi:hypothetical protein
MKHHCRERDLHEVQQAEGICRPSRGGEDQRKTESIEQKQAPYDVFRIVSKFRLHLSECSIGDDLHCNRDGEQCGGKRDSKAFRNAEEQ